MDGSKPNPIGKLIIFWNIIFVSFVFFFLLSHIYSEHILTLLQFKYLHHCHFQHVEFSLIFQGITAEQMTKSAWDFVFLGKEYKSCAVPKEKLEVLRNEFLFVTCPS